MAPAAIIAAFSLLILPKLTGSVAGHCGGQATDHCLGKLLRHGLTPLGTTHAVVETCGDENPLEVLLFDPTRLGTGRTQQFLETGLQVPAARKAFDALTDAMKLLKEHARSLLDLVIEFGYSCYEGEACMPTRDVYMELRQRHRQFLQVSSSLLTKFASESGASMWIVGIGDPAQILARHAYGRHVEFAASVLNGLEAGMEMQPTFSLLHDLASRVAIARCDMQAQMLAHFTLVQILPPQATARSLPLPRFEFFSDACCRRYHVLSKLVEQLLENRSPDSEPLRILEVGVNNGITSQFLLSKFEAIRLDGVDPWIERDAIYKDAQNRLESFGDRVRLWRLPSAEAARHFDPATFDLVFIDGDHAKDAVATDIQSWRSRVRPGGLLAGHDLFNPAFEGVLEALLDHVQLNVASAGESPTINFAPDYLWWLHM
eukprot:TRINITY_DN30271_c0_g2_i1.p1 TRINITY_DN30271_c0_g2~~TRINITY_DN30271_c0_g2_i1.p1  ORF type:complete len:448 (-),score=65.69 TRINITY_DN30271_c0_g2_i1:9-1301(-)